MQQNSDNFTLEAKLIKEDEKIAIRSIQITKAETSSDLFKTTHVRTEELNVYLNDSSEII